MEAVGYRDFAEFYPYYLSQHRHRLCRRAHFIGTTLAIAAIAWSLIGMQAWWLLAAPIGGYGGAWIGHAAFEKNRPASFDYPWWSFRADWLMYWQMLAGKISW